MIRKAAAYGISLTAVILMNLLFISAFGEYGQALWFVAFIVLSVLIRLGIGIGRKRTAARELGLSETQRSGN